LNEILEEMCDVRRTKNELFDNIFVGSSLIRRAKFTMSIEYRLIVNAFDWGI